MQYCVICSNVLGAVGVPALCHHHGFQGFTPSQTLTLKVLKRLSVLFKFAFIFKNLSTKLKENYHLHKAGHNSNIFAQFQLSKKTSIAPNLSNRAIYEALKVWAIVFSLRSLQPAFTKLAKCQISAQSFVEICVLG